MVPEGYYTAGTGYYIDNGTGSGTAFYRYEAPQPEPSDASIAELIAAYRQKLADRKRGWQDYAVRLVTRFLVPVHRRIRDALGSRGIGALNFQRRTA